MGSITGEAPQTVANRNKNELLGIYRSSLADITAKLDDLEHLLDYLQTHQNSEKRTGEATIRLGVLNSGDSEGVVYPKALLRSAAGEIDLAPTTAGNQILGPSSGGYVVVPARSFREVTFTMDRSTRGDAAENWKKLLQATSGNDITVVLQTSAGSLTAKGKLPL